MSDEVTPIALSPATLSEMLDGVNVSTLNKWRQAGIGPAWFKVGNLVRYRRSAVEEWLQEQEGRTRAS